MSVGGRTEDVNFPLFERLEEILIGKSVPVLATFFLATSVVSATLSAVLDL